MKREGARRKFWIKPLKENKCRGPSLIQPLTARLHRRFLSQQLNSIFVAPKLQRQNRTCKPLYDFGAILAIYRRGMRYNSRNTVTLSSSFTF